MSSPPEEAWERAIAEAHDGYHDETRLHRDPDVLVEDVVSWRMLSPHLMRALAFLVAPTVLLVIYLLLDYLASTSGPSITGRLVMNVLLAVIVVLYLAGVAAFFAPAKEPIAEYSRLLENRAGAARGAYDWVTRAARARRTPAEVAPSTVAGVPVLLFRQRAERAMLLVQPYGQDLYVGWTMWRSRSTATLLAHFLRDTFGRFAPLPVFSAELRAASTRAMRESVHSLAREGVAAAAWADRAADRAADPSRRRVEQPGPPAAATGGANPPTEADPPRRRERPQEGLPRSAPAADPTADWAQQEEREYVTRDDSGWGPPPR
ncbi:hypothetical protein GCM10023201_00610 [Actinomycetospora corticicola]|uniref:Uncharacterized protein n=1 Tax=Actinomycetospora corticicola TaxID=663602 RepID=A0A7Y9E1D9_9PSEU|nr:hypothetical protein [Actinomycetospora corticicola]NYD39344.1 hypothetical protein [Actinomycetospora corticicola]